MKTKFLPFIFPLILLLGGCEQKESADVVAQNGDDGPLAESEILAVVNGVAIPQSRVTVYAPAEIDPQRAKAVIDNIIATELLAQKAAMLGLARRPDVREQLAVAKQAVLGRAYAADFLLKNSPGEEDIQTRYEEVKNQYEGKLEYDASHILLKDEALAKETLAKATADPSQFGELAKLHSQDPGSAVNGGKLGWVTAQTLVPEFSAVMENTPVGQVAAELAKSKFGWHIVRVDATRDIVVPVLDDALRGDLEQAIQADKFRRHLEDLRAAADIEIK